MAATRRLAAILAADVAGYSRLMGADEEGTLELLKALRRELLDPKKHPEAKQEPARRFADWLASPEGQTAIGAYGINGEHCSIPRPTRQNKRVGLIEG